MADDRLFLDRLAPVFLDSFFVVDSGRRLTKFNSAFVQLLGLRSTQRREVMGTPCYELLQLDICRDKCIALQALEKDGHIRMEEIRGRAPDGRELVLALSAIPLRGDDGSVVGVFVTHRDVTDERRLKTRSLEQQEAHRNERETLLKIIRDHEEELETLRRRAKRR
jgi:PAS domain S-box-containing protein